MTQEAQGNPHWLVRAVPRLVLAAGVLALATGLAIARHAGLSPPASVEAQVGRFDVLIVYTTPSLRMIVDGVLISLAIVLIVHGTNALAARRSTRRAETPTDARERPLRAEAVADHVGVGFAVTALIPACNEELNLPSTIASLRAQTVPPATIWVIADNCTDGTEVVARSLGVKVYPTVGNTFRKAGGLNQLLARLLPATTWNDLVLVMDADTIMVDDFLERAIDELTAEPELSAVGGVFYGDSTPGLVAQLQRNEYQRYGRDVARQKGRVFVLTGTASVFRAPALRTVSEGRGTLLPGEVGHVYDTFSLTEDNELTMALRALGAGMVSPMRCRVRTQLMPTWRDLWNQRQRWQRGALENIGMYGVTPSSATNWLQQLGLGYGVLSFTTYVALTTLSYLAFGIFTVVVFWVLVGALFMIERQVTVWRGGWRARLLALPMVIELVYAGFLQAVYVKSLIDIASGKSKAWNAAVVDRATS